MSPSTLPASMVMLARVVLASLVLAAADCCASHLAPAEARQSSSEDKNKADEEERNYLSLCKMFSNDLRRNSPQASCLLPTEI